MASIVFRMRPGPLLLLALVAGACGDDGSTGTTGSSSSGPSTTTDPNTSTSTSTSTGAPDPTGTTGTPEPTSTTGTGSDGPDPSTSTGAAEDSTGSTGEIMATTGSMGNVVYSAIALPGGLDRIRIGKADLDGDRCTWVVLVTPAIAGMYPGVTVPMGWSVESIAINDVAAACDSDNPAMFGAEAALDGNGTVGFGMLGGTGIYPCTVDIDASFDFQGVIPGIPPTDDMIATDIPVTGC